MYRFFLVGLILLFMSSCASLINSSYKTITVHTQDSVGIYFRDGSIRTVNNQASFPALRKKDTIQFTTVRDSVSKTYIVKNKLSFAFFSNIPLYFGAGMLVDLLSPRRFTYPSHIYLDSTHQEKGYYTYEKVIANNKWELLMGIPIINLNHRDQPHPYPNFIHGWNGFTLGLNYFHKDNRYFNLTGQTYFMQNFPLILPILLQFNRHNKEFVYHLTFSDNYRISKFHVGYGFSYAYKEQKYFYLVSNSSSNPSKELLASSSVSKSKSVNPISLDIDDGADFENGWNMRHLIGVYIPVSYELTKNWLAQFQYSPSIYQLNTKQFKYEALYSLGINYRIKL